MTSVFRLHPEDLSKKMKYINNIGNNKGNDSTNYHFLDNIKEKYDIDVNIYYIIIKSIEEFKLKNLFYFINLRLKKIDEKIEYSEVNDDNINSIFVKYIDNNIYKSIMVMNFIQQYIYPLHN